jgi:rRNA maturation endonuclease Nob1
VEEESNVAARQAEIEMATEKAAASVKSGKRQTDGNVVCESCGARVKPGKFCSECGGTMTIKLHCKSCNAELEDSPKFCPECGQRL